MVLSKDAKKQQLRLTRKRALVAQATQLPRTLDDLTEGLVSVGYVASVTKDAVFVRFMGSLTGRAGLAQMADTFVPDPSKLFSLGQTVRAQVGQVDKERQRFSVNLKPALTASPDASLLESLFRDQQLALELKRAHGDEDLVPWPASLSVGSAVDCTVDSNREWGVTVNLDGAPEAVGVVLEEQMDGGKVQPEERIRCRVLDINYPEGIVQLSMRPDLLAAAASSAAAVDTGKKGGKKKAKADAGAPAAAAAPEEGSTVDVTVEAHLDEFVVASLNNGQMLGFFSNKDLNLTSVDVKSRFPLGAAVRATVHRAPEAATGNRLLLHVPLVAGKGESAVVNKGKAGERVKEKVKLEVGTVLKAQVTAVHHLHVEVKLIPVGRGRVHVTELGPHGPISGLSTESAPFEVAILGPAAGSEGRLLHLLECSARPEAIEVAKSGQKPTAVLDWTK